MDPNDNLREQAELIVTPRRDKRRLRELREGLLHWTQRGGFEPNWDDYPEATKAFNAWRKRAIGY